MNKMIRFGLWGLLGGIGGALLGESVFHIPWANPLAQAIVWTGCISLGISFSIVIAQNRYLRRGIIQGRQSTLLIAEGLAIGGLAGAAGQLLYQVISGRLGQGAEFLEGAAAFIGWLILGALVGWGMGFFIPNLPRGRAGLSGAFGGLVAVWIRLEFSQFDEVFGPLQGAIIRFASAAVLGFLIGLVVAWVDTALRDAWLEVLYGNNESRTVRLGDTAVTIGGSESCTIYARGAPPIAGKFKFVNGSVASEDPQTNRVSIVPSGREQRIGNVTIRVCTALQTPASSNTSPEYRLRISRGMTVPLSVGTVLRADDIPGIDAAAGATVAEVLRNPKDASIIGLKNLGRRDWRAATGNTEPRQVPPGRSLTLAPGTTVDLGGVRGSVELGQARGAIATGRWVPNLLLCGLMLLVLGLASLRAWHVGNGQTGIAHDDAPPEVTDDPELENSELESEPVNLPPPPEPAPIDPTPRIAVQYTPEGRFGLSTTSGNPDDPNDDNKRLTFSANGGTNNTRIWIDGASPLFGIESPGRLIRPMTEVTAGNYECEWECQGIRVLLTARFIGDEASRRTTLVRVEYRAVNQSGANRTVGLRVMLDALIGDNDGVPFFVPGVEGIVTSPQSYDGEYVPHFIQALETPDIRAPGVIAFLGLRPSGVERPTRVILTHWPGSGAEYEYDGAAPFGSDTAIGLYFEPRLLAPNAARQMAFDYGLGSIATTTSAELTFNQSGGPFRSGGEFYIGVLVQNPRAGQRVRLTLPPGLTLKNESPEKPVPVGGQVTQIAWRVMVDAGFFGIAEVVASIDPDGAEQRHNYEIQPREPRLILKPQGSRFIVGKMFWVSALIQNPREGQEVELELPANFSFDAGHSHRKRVPPAKPGQRHAQVNWLVKPEAAVAKRIQVRLSPDNIVDEAMIEVMPRSLLGAE